MERKIEMLAAAVARQQDALDAYAAKNGGDYYPWPSPSGASTRLRRRLLAAVHGDWAVFAAAVQTVRRKGLVRPRRRALTTREGERRLARRRLCLVLEVRVGGFPAITLACPDETTAMRVAEALEDVVDVQVQVQE